MRLLGQDVREARKAARAVPQGATKPGGTAFPTPLAALSPGLHALGVERPAGAPWRLACAPHERPSLHPIVRAHARRN